MASIAHQARMVGADDTRMPRIDYWLMTSVIALATLGLVMVASASITFADREIGQPFYYALRQAVFMGVGLAVGVALFKVRLVDLERMGVLLLVSALVMLLLVPIIGLLVTVISRRFRKISHRID